jgi:hypothetical protein
MTGTLRDRPAVPPLPRSAAAAHGKRSARLAAAERRISAVSRVLDDLVTVPGTQRRIGVEPVLGLLPGAGDVISAAVGVWLIVEATRFKLPAVVVGRMVLNTLIDLIVGIVPIVGDLFDFAFKSNTRNVALFRRYAADPTASTREHGLVLLGAVVVIVGVAWLLLAALGALLSIEVGLP